MTTSRRLYLYRHAKSDWADPSLDDIDRPLNKRGRKAAEAMARYIVGRGWRPDFIVCSPSLRTRATLDGLLAETGSLPVAIEDAVYEARSDEILACLRGLDEGFRAVMVIGHNPGLENLAARLSGKPTADDARREITAKFPTAALAVFDVAIDRWSGLHEAAASLAAFVRPRDLK